MEKNGMEKQRNIMILMVIEDLKENIKMGKKGVEKEKSIMIWVN